MRIVYLSSASVPSRTANSIHVMKMCQAFARSGHEVVLIVPRRRDVELGINNVCSYYGVESCFRIRYLSWLPILGRRYIYGYLAANQARMLRADVVYGRDLIGCSFAASSGMTVIFESHAPIDYESRGGKAMFGMLVHAAGFRRLIVITTVLKDYYLDRYPCLAGRIQVVADGADPVSTTVEPLECPRGAKLLHVGYVGHLYPGRGVEVVEHLARACEWACFHVIGGTERDIERYRARSSSVSNLVVHGFKSPAEAERYRLGVDVLIAPYQKRVAVHGGTENRGLDTVSYMSPLKIFEYMAAGKAIICSNLPVLREILTNNVNAMLVSPDDCQAWQEALMLLRDDPGLRARLGDAARAEHLSNYTWSQRVEKVLTDHEPQYTGSDCIRRSPGRRRQGDGFRTWWQRRSRSSDKT